MTETVITLRLTIDDPVPGVRYGLQQDDAVFEPVTATDAPLSFDVPVRLTDDGRFLGPFVRREGPKRRFVYIRIGQSAGQHGTDLNRRAKIDIHDIPPALLDQARQGRTLEIRLPGRGKDGTPACATVRSLTGWTAH
ncbi:hypothetical protein ASG17_07055 [Brevundimonas sp. Leaf363]|uniref:DUF5990 family protein n=1 Tax=Brevundimonas sp. Leaf363 TaxID=1736353 RepID=UPI0006F6A45E|nr:DUF5990 family protein [Brevundimonas sp. Leaf363]KQS55811.1 hypothetical protein ASG17_07055 [Brevundimonas sp. Leaf363]